MRRTARRKLEHRLSIAVAVVLCGPVVFGVVGVPSAGASAVAPPVMSAGERHICIVMPDSTVSCAGDSAHSELGIGPSGVVGSLHTVPGVSDAVSVSSGYFRTCAVTAAGRVVCWGQAGGLPPYPPIMPTAVNGITDATKVAVGTNGACALRLDHTVGCWSVNDAVAVAGVSDVIDLSITDKGPCAVKRDGSVVCWTLFASVTGTPAILAGVSGAVMISSSGATFCVVRTDHTVMCWGSNGNAGGGLPYNINPLPPTVVPGLTDVAQVSEGGSQGCAVRRDGTVWCWGVATFGRDIPTAHTPRQLSGLTDAVSVIVGGSQACALRSSGQVVCWGLPFTFDFTANASYLANYSMFSVAVANGLSVPTALRRDFRVHVGPINAVVVAQLTTDNYTGGSGWTAAFSCATGYQGTSSLNNNASPVASNLVIVPSDANGDICVKALYPTDLIVDVSGTLGASDIHTPIRVLDTR